MVHKHFKHHAHNHQKRNRKHDKAALQKLHEAIAGVLASKFDEAKEQPKTAAEGWLELQNGNKRFSEGRLEEYILHLAHEINPDRRQQLGLGQHPFAVILTCSDSRVSPELIFDQGLGELFVVRTAGNVPDNVALGSVEYGLLHLKAPLLVVLGHTKCGAVTATLDVLGAGKAAEKKEDDKSHIGSIVAEIRPCAEGSFKKYGGAHPKVLYSAVKHNARAVAERIPVISPPIKQLVDSKAVTVVAAVYDIDTGIVSQVNQV